MFLCGINSSSGKRHINDIDEEKIEQMLVNQRFDELFLITTTCFDAGANIIDAELHTVVADVKNYSYENKPTENPFDQKSEYNTIQSYTINKSICLSNETETVIAIEYVTRVEKNDLTYVCRVARPCKKYKLKFQLCGDNNEHKINSAAFGFIDNARNTHNTCSKNEVCYEFDDWIFTQDGISINFS